MYMCVSVRESVCVCVCVRARVWDLGGWGLLRGGDRRQCMCGGPEKALVLVTGTSVPTLPLAG